MTDFIDKDFNNWWNDDPFFKDNPFRKDSPAYWAWEGWQAGLKVGMKREHALWVLAKIGQEIEDEEKDEYCEHGIRHERHCKSCECIEQADMRSEM